MFHSNILLSPQIGNRPRNLQYSVMRPGAKSLLLHCPLQQPFGI